MAHRYPLQSHRWSEMFIPFIMKRAHRSSEFCSDRASLFNMLVGLNGYTICSGIINEELNGPGIVARTLDVDDYMEIGYILPTSIKPSAMTLNYIDILKSLSPGSSARRT